MRQPDDPENHVLFGTKSAAQMLDLDPSTLRGYEEKGVVNPQRTSTGHRVYTVEDLAAIRAYREGLTR